MEKQFLTMYNIAHTLYIMYIISGNILQSVQKTYHIHDKIIPPKMDIGQNRKMKRACNVSLESYSIKCKVWYIY